MEEQKQLFKCANDLKATIIKSNGEMVLDEECCTAVTIILKNTGDIASSFLGAHNPEIVKILDKSIKMYFKSIKKTLKKEFSTMEEEIKVVRDDLPKEDKWTEENKDKINEKEKISKTHKTTAKKVSPKAEDIKKTTKSRTKKVTNEKLK